GLRRVAQNVHRMEIAVAQAIAIRHVVEAIEQDLLLWVVERHGAGDVRCQPTLQAAELARRVGMNACMQASEDLEILVYGGRVSPHLFREGYTAHTVKHDTPAAADLLYAPDRGNWKPQTFHRGVDRPIAECGLTFCC